MNKPIPYADTILGFLMAKNWIIESVEVLNKQPYNYLLKPPTNLSIEDEAFRYKIPARPDEENLPLYWNYLSIIIDGISTIYQLKKEDTAIFYQPLSKALETYAHYQSQSIEREKKQELAAA